VVFTPMSAVMSVYSNSSRTSASISFLPEMTSSIRSTRPLRVFSMPAFSLSSRLALRNATEKGLNHLGYVDAPSKNHAQTRLYQRSPGITATIGLDDADRSLQIQENLDGEPWACVSRHGSFYRPDGGH